MNVRVIKSFAILFAVGTYVTALFSFVAYSAGHLMDQFDSELVSQNIFVSGVMQLMGLSLPLVALIVYRVYRPSLAVTQGESKTDTDAEAMVYRRWFAATVISSIAVMVLKIYLSVTV